MVFVSMAVVAGCAGDGIYRIYYKDDGGPIVVIDKSGSWESRGFMECFDGLMFAG